RYVINEIHKGNVPAIKRRRTDVIPPPDVRIRDVVKIETVPAAQISRRWIDGLRIGVRRLQLQIAGHSAVNLSLQAVIVRVGSCEVQKNGIEPGILKGTPLVPALVVARLANCP